MPRLPVWTLTDHACLTDCPSTQPTNPCSGSVGRSALADAPSPPLVAAVANQATKFHEGRPRSPRAAGCSGNTGDPNCSSPGDEGWSNKSTRGRFETHR